MSQLQIQKLNRKITADFSLHNISLSVPAGSILTLIGKSGSGKSTLLRCLAGLESYQVEAETKPAAAGFVFQSSNLFSHLSLEDNIKLALLKVQNKTQTEASAICGEVLAQVKLSHRGKHFPHELSGGQQQRGTIARALALKPQLILYDEPTSSLDPELVDELLELMLELKKTGITQVVATHEKEAIRKISDYVGFLNQGELKLFESFSNVKAKAKELSVDEQKYLQLFI